MDVTMTWEPSETAKSGLAVYTLGSTQWHFYLPRFSLACNIHMALNDVFSTGRALGRQEVVSAVKNAANAIETPF